MKLSLGGGEFGKADELAHCLCVRPSVRVKLRPTVCCHARGADDKQRGLAGLEARRWAPA